MLKDKFVRASTWLFIATMVTNIFNYIFQVSMGRLLSTEDFGLMNAMFALFLITSLPFNTIMTVLAKYVSNYMVGNDYSSIKGLFIRSYKNVFRIALLLLIIFLSLSLPIRSFLKMDGITPIILLGFAIFTSLVLPLNSAFLQGLQKFRSLGAVNGILGPTKFVLCSLMVLLGFRVNGVFWGLILCNVCVFFVSYLPLKTYLKTNTASHSRIAGLFAYAIPVLLANFCFAILTQVDLVLVRHYFPASQVGLYATASVLGKAIMYLPASFILALFPLVAEAHAKNQRSGTILFKAMGLTLLLSGSGALIFLLAPEFIIGFFFSERYLAAAPLLGIYGIAMLPMGLLLILIQYSLASSRIRFVNYLLVTAFLHILLVVLFHQTLTTVLWIIFGCGTGSMIIMLLSCLFEKSALTAGSPFKMSSEQVPRL